MKTFNKAQSSLREQLQNMHPFQPLNLTFLVCGCGVFLPTKFSLAVNRFMRVFTIVIFIAEVLSNVEGIKNRVLERPLTHAGWYVRIMSSMAFMITVGIKRSHLADSVSSSLDDLSSRQKRSLLYHSVVWTLLNIIWCVRGFVVQGAHLVAERAGLHHIVGDIFSEIRSVMIPWYMGGIATYTFLVKMVLSMEENYFEKLHQQLKLKTDPQELAKERWLLSDRRTQLFAPLSIIPVMWFTYSFVMFAAAIMEVTSLSRGQAERYLKFLTMLSQIALLFYLIMTCDRVTRSIRFKANEVIGWLMTSKQADRYSLLIEQLKECANMEFNASSMFDINRQFISAFTSSLITFTVMFIQIAGTLAVPQSKVPF